MDIVKIIVATLVLVFVVLQTVGLIQQIKDLKKKRKEKKAEENKSADNSKPS